ncbi:MAG: hypothetical protein CTY12_00995 [Methylotenera sp.]|nr:MAG: hypothetical protein CTY12_00995 [Methylotenera sp.]
MRDLLIDLLDLKSIVAYRPQFARALGSATAALFLSQAIYWQQKVGEGHYFYKKRDAERDDHNRMLEPKTSDQQSWEWELGLSRYEQESSRKLLKKHHLLKEKLEGMPAKTYYCVDYDALVTFLQINFKATAKKQTTQQNQSVSDHHLAGGKTTNQPDEKPLTSRAVARQQAGGDAPNSLVENPPTTYKETKTTTEMNTNSASPLPPLVSIPHAPSVIQSINLMQSQTVAASPQKMISGSCELSLQLLEPLATLQIFGESLIMPKCLADAQSDLQRVQILQMLHALHDVALAQSVLDELAGAVARGNIKMPTKLLAKLITEARRGVFIPDAAIAIKQSRDRAYANAKAITEQHARAKTKAKPACVTTKQGSVISLRQVLDNLNQAAESHTHVR